MTAVMVGLTLVASAATAAHNEPAKAKGIKGAFVTAHQPCVVPDSFTSSFIPACPPAIQGNSCNFTAKGSGKFSVSVSGKGATRDVKIRAKLAGVSGCDGETLNLVADMRTTADDCGGVSCTTIDVLGFPVGSCTVAAGECAIKTTLNTLDPGMVQAGKNTAFTILGIRVTHGANTAFESGILVP